MDYYNILGVQKDATDEVIKKAYKKLALQYHPDRGTGNEEQFKNISEAYSVLSDPEKRKIYDIHGKEGVQGMEHGNSHFGGNPFDMFNGMFHPKMRRQPRNKEVELPLTLEEVFLGKCKTVDIKRRTIDQTQVTKCTDCDGSGAKVRISNLGGMMFQEAVSECPGCHGVGNIVPDNCVKISEEKIGLNIPPGCSEGSRIVAHGMMDQVPGEEPGDLIFVITYKAHNTYKALDNGDLEAVIEINLFEALTGFTRILKHLDGTFITFTHNDICTPETKWSIRNEGLRTHCNLHIRLNIKFPTTVSIENEGLTHILHQKKITQRISHKDATAREVKLENYITPVRTQPRNTTHATGPECVQQ